MTTESLTLQDVVLTLLGGIFDYGPAVAAAVISVMMYRFTKADKAGKKAQTQEEETMARCKEHTTAEAEARVAFERQVNTSIDTLRQEVRREMKATSVRVDAMAVAQANAEKETARLELQSERRFGQLSTELQIEVASVRELVTQKMDELKNIVIAGLKNNE